MLWRRYRLLYAGSQSLVIEQGLLIPRLQVSGNPVIKCRSPRSYDAVVCPLAQIVRQITAGQDQDPFIAQWGQGLAQLQ